MVTQAFALEHGGPKRLEISWSGAWNDVQLTLDGLPIGGFKRQRELEAGRTFTLPDGSQLQVQLKRKGLDTTLRLMRNGKPLPGSTDGKGGTSSPAERVAQAANFVYFAAGANVVMGLIAEVWSDTLRNAGVGLGSVVVGAILGGLAYWVKSKQSRLALVLALAMCVVDTLLSVVDTKAGGGGRLAGQLVIRAPILMLLLRALPALGEIERARTPQVLSWTDRRALNRRLNQQGIESPPAPADPRRWWRRLQIGLAISAVVLSIGVAIARFGSPTREVMLARCQQHSSDDEVDRCLTTWAARSGDSALCKGIHRAHRFQACVSGMYELTYHGKKCQRIEAAEQRNRCIADLVGSGGDPSLCELIEAGDWHARCVAKAGDRWRPHQ